MNPLIKDYLFRWKELFVGAGLVQLLLTGTLLAGDRMPPLIAIIVAGVIPLSIDAARGFFRVSLVLPVPRKQLATNWWLITVALPTAYSLIIIVGGEVLFSLISGKNLFNPSHVVMAPGLTFLATGTMFFAFIGMPQGVVSGLKNNLIGGIYGMLWGLSFAGLIFISMVAPNGLADLKPWHWLFVLLAGSATMAGYHNRDQLLVRKTRLMQNDSGGSTRAPANRSELRTGLSGFPLLVVQQLKMVAYIGTMLFFFSIVFAMIGNELRGGNSGESMVQAMLSGNGGAGAFGFWFMLPAIALIPTMQVKSLRIMPIRVSRLALHMVSTPILCNLIVIGVILLLARAFNAKPNFNALLTVASSGSAVIVIAVPVILRWGLNWGTYLALFVGAMMATIAPALPRSTGMDSNTAIIALGAITLLCWIATTRLLGHSNHPYRQALLRIGLFRGR